MRVAGRPAHTAALLRHFGSDSVFLASQSIRAGDDYVREVFDRLRECSVLLAVIGPHWTTVTGNSAFDWVHREIHEALTSGIRVVPVLIEDAKLPGRSELPDDIADLARCQAVRLRHYSLDTDVVALVDELRRTVPALRQRSGAATTMAEGMPIRYAVPGTRCRIGIAPGTIRRVKAHRVWVTARTPTCRHRHRSGGGGGADRAPDGHNRIRLHVRPSRHAAAGGQLPRLYRGGAFSTTTGCRRTPTHPARPSHIDMTDGESTGGPLSTWAHSHSP
jgi:hypothetical protein